MKNLPITRNDGPVSFENLRKIGIKFCVDKSNAAAVSKIGGAQVYAFYLPV